MVKPTDDDRRLWTRAKRVLSIQYRLVKGVRRRSETTWKLSTTEDMSIGGLSFYTDHEYKVGDVLELKVVMSGILDIFNGYGQVVRTTERGKKGICFLTAIKFVERVGRSRSVKSYNTTKKAVRKVTPRKTTKKTAS